MNNIKDLRKEKVMSLSNKEKVAVGVLIGVVLLSIGNSKKDVYSSEENYVSDNQYEEQNTNDGYYQEEEQNTDDEYSQEENPTNDEQAVTEENDTASQEEETEKKEEKSVQEIMNETGFPADRLNTAYKDINDAVGIAMANGTSGIHELEFIVSEDGTQLVGIFRNGTEVEYWGPAHIMDANTLRMYYEDSTMDFSWVEGCGAEELEITATGNMVSDLVNEFAGRTLN